jgi:hypothetical protein
VSVGFTLTKQDIDGRAGQLVMALRDDLYRINQMNTLLLDTSIFADNAAIAALGYTAGEVTTLKAAFADLNQLYLVAHAQATQGATNDFFFNAKHLVGLL